MVFLACHLECIRLDLLINIGWTCIEWGRLFSFCFEKFHIIGVVFSKGNTSITISTVCKSCGSHAARSWTIGDSATSHSWSGSGSNGKQFLVVLRIRQSSLHFQLIFFLNFNYKVFHLWFLFFFFCFLTIYLHMSSYIFQLKTFTRIIILISIYIHSSRQKPDSNFHVSLYTFYSNKKNNYVELVYKLNLYVNVFMLQNISFS